MNPYAILAACLAWAGTLAAVGGWQHHAGRTTERAEWQDREIGELRTANQKILDITTAARRAEHENAAALAAVATDYERKLDAAKDRHARDIAAVRSGALRLRDPHSAGLPACGSAAAPVGTGAGGRDGPAPGELSEAAAGFLLQLTDDADAVAEQLAACQRVVIEDRRLGGE